MFAAAVTEIKDGYLEAAMPFRTGPNNGGGWTVTKVIAKLDSLAKIGTISAIQIYENGSCRVPEQVTSMAKTVTIYKYKDCLTPELGLGFYDSGRDYRLGWRLSQPDAGEPFAFSFDMTRRESANNNGNPPQHPWASSPAMLGSHAQAPIPMGRHPDHAAVARGGM